MACPGRLQSSIHRVPTRRRPLRVPSEWREPGAVHLPAGDQHQPRHTGIAGQLGAAGDKQIKRVKTEKKGIKKDKRQGKHYIEKRLEKDKQLELM